LQLACTKARHLKRTQTFVRSMTLQQPHFRNGVGPNAANDTGDVPHRPNVYVIDVPRDNRAAFPTGHGGKNTDINPYLEANQCINYPR
jgi:hypothetical protein